MIGWLNLGDYPTWLHVDKVIEHYRERSGGDCRFLAELTTRDHRGIWSEVPRAIFWQEKLIDPTHSHYFGVFSSGRRGQESAMITDGSSVAEVVWHGLQAASGEIIFSRFRHDFRESRDGTCTVDGGQDYGKYSGNGRPVSIRIVDGQFTWEYKPEWKGEPHGEEV